MYKRILSYLGSAALLVSSFVSCSDDKDEVRDLASKCEITLGTYYGAGQKNVTTILKDTDRAAIMLNAGGTTYSAAAARCFPAPAVPCSCSISRLHLKHPTWYAGIRLMKLSAWTEKT